MAYRTINPNQDGAVRQEEHVSAGTITPGDLVEFTTAGEVQRHASSGITGVGNPFFALENKYDDSTANSVDANYASSDTIFVGFFQTGQKVYCRLSTKASTGVNYGDFCESDGAGGLGPVTTTTAASTAGPVERVRVVQARETSTDSTGRALFEARVL